MSLNIMKFLIAAVSGVLLFVPVESHAGEGDFDLEKLQTTQGRTYREVLILGADRHGLTFRHREGIAKIAFPDLSENVRMLYEVSDEPSDFDELEGSQAADSAGPAGTDADGAAGTILTVHHRLTLYTPTDNRFLCHPCQDGMYWSSSWSRYHPAHQLTIPCYRERSVRDFLILSGLSGNAFRGDSPGFSTRGVFLP